MDTFESTLKLIKPNMWFASVDLRHAYYSVPICKEHRKFLRFEWKNEIYQYTCLPNGIGCAPRLFTKLMKPIYAKLRKMGYTNSGYIDDSLLMGDSKIECQNNVSDTVSLIESVGFIIHENKSVLIPVQKIVFLGNYIDSKKMIVSLTESRRETILLECKSLMNRTTASIRDVARVIGLMVAAFSAVQHGPLFYRNLEREKIMALRINKGDYSAKMPINCSMKSDLVWWIENLPSSFRKISQNAPDTFITTDASSTGWGSVCSNTRIGGRWTSEEAKQHINYLELLAIFYAIKSFCKDVSNGSHIQVMTDNTCAMSYVNNMGGIKSIDCDDLAKKIWLWAIEKHFWVSAAYIPGAQNCADFASRNHNDNIEWMLDRNLFGQICELWECPSIDMFASRINKQLTKFVSWKPDPEAEFIDAFSMNWSNIYFYAFPPFCLIPRLLAKMRADQSNCILIAPVWLTQSWFPAVMEMLIELPYLLPSGPEMLKIPGTTKVHPLYKKLTLMACRLSGMCCKNENFRRTLPISLWPRGGLELNLSTQCTYKNGFSTVMKNKLVTFKHLLKQF
jgi:hypothetical protein